MITATIPAKPIFRPNFELSKFTWKSKLFLELESWSSIPLTRGRRRLILMVEAKGRQDNRKPLQKGRNLSIEAIQAVQTLKRAYYFSNDDGRSLRRAFRYNFGRLLKFDMLAVLRELLRQNHCLLAIQVFEDIRKEYWYKPQLSLYNEMIKVMASNGFMEQVAVICIYLKTESNLEAETEAFNALFTTFITFNLSGHVNVMEFYHLMKAANCEPDRSTFRILINGLESIGESSVSAILREDARKWYDESLEFLEEQEEENKDRTTGQQAKEWIAR